MDILNFISWIASKRRVVTSAPDDALVPIGIRTETRDDKYTTVAIKKSDLITTPEPAYKVYAANVELANGFATVFENTLGVSISWTATSGQISTGTVTGLIGQNNVFVQATSNTATSIPKIVSANFAPSPWRVAIQQTDNAGVADSTQQVYVEIRVYN